MHAHVKSAAGQFDLKRVTGIADKLRALKAELIDLFPEREYVIEQFIIALLMREHVMIFGIYGTGKSDLLSTVFGAFEGSEIFSIALTKFMTESHVFGIPDPKIMREEGRIHHRIKGTALDSHFLELDEFLDASRMLLRALLGLLNERKVERGEQIIHVPLHTAIATTNGSPEQAIAVDPELGAVFDRFLFQSKVNWLETPKGRQRMLKKTLLGERSDVKIPFVDLQYISSIVVDSNLVNDPYLIEIYDEIVQAYRLHAKDQKISDRRVAKLFSIAEANALLNGRLEVIPEDLLAVRWGLCPGHDVKLHDLFLKIATPIVEKANKAQQQQIDEVQKKLLESYAQKVSAVPAKLASPELVKLKRELLGVQKSVKDVKPQTDVVRAYQEKILKAVAERLQAVDDQINVPDTI